MKKSQYLCCYTLTAWLIFAGVQADGQPASSDTTEPVTSRQSEDPSQYNDAIRLLDPIINGVDTKTYRLSPGDQIRITVSGTVPSDLVCPISPDGSVVVSPIGRVQLAGLTLGESRNKLSRAMVLYLRHAQVIVTLISLRRFSVNISGEVKQPGKYSVTGRTGIAELVLRAGGFTNIASRRNISILDNPTGFTRNKVDFIKYTNLGDLKQNPLLEPNETVYVPANPRQVSIAGQVARPGTYELLPGDTLDNIVRLAGGFSPIADEQSILLGRLTAAGQRDLIRVDASSSQGQTTPLQDGDTLQIVDKTLNQARVLVIGELLGPNVMVDRKPKEVEDHSFEEFPREGTVYIREGQTVRDLVLSLGGPTARADLQYTWLERPGDKGQKAFYPIDLDLLLHDYAAGISQDLILKNGDTLVVPRRSDTVFVVGQVLHSGPYPWNPRYTLRDYLGLAGGPTPDASTKHGRIVRRVPGKQPLVYEIDLLRVIEDGWDPSLDIRAGDVVYVPHFQTFYKDALNILATILPLVYYIH